MQKIVFLLSFNLLFSSFAFANFITGQSCIGFEGESWGNQCTLDGQDRLWLPGLATSAMTYSSAETIINSQPGWTIASDGLFFESVLNANGFDTNNWDATQAAQYVADFSLTEVNGHSRMRTALSNGSGEHQVFWSHSVGGSNILQFTSDAAAGADVQTAAFLPVSPPVSVSIIPPLGLLYLGGIGLLAGLRLSRSRLG